MGQIGFVGGAVPLSVSLGDGATVYFPQAKIYDGSSLVDSVSLSHVASGYYTNTYTPVSSGNYSVIYSIYSDAPHTTLATIRGYPTYVISIEELQVFDTPFAGENGVIRQSFTLDEGSDSVYINVWLEVNGVAVSSGVSTATLSLYEGDGTLISTATPQASPVGQGVFQFTMGIPPFPVGENASFSVATIVYAGPPSRTFRGVTGATFSKSA